MIRSDRVVIVDNGSRHLNALVQLCREFGSVAVVPAGDRSHVTATDLVILSGSHAHSITGSTHFYSDERKLVLSHRGPLIGVCAGMELISSAYGGRLGKMREGANGPRTIQILDSSLRLGLGGEPTARVAERHGWAVTRVSPPLRVLAESDAGIEVLRHEGRPMFGMQFHPELSPADGRRIFEWAVMQVGIPAAA